MPRLGYRGPITVDDLREPAELEHPALRIAVERARSGSRPRERTDPHVLALAIEGGGVGGAVSAGMCVMLDALGLVPSFDVIYGCSAGALNGLWTAAGQAPLGATNYEDVASREFVSLWRLLRGRPVVDLGFLFHQIAGWSKPYSPKGLAAGPAFRAVATDVDRDAVRVLRDFAGPQETLAAVRASCAMPVLGGPLPVVDGAVLADGGLIESVPFASALRDGATHVLVLRSRAADHRKRAANRFVLAAVARQHPALRPLMRQRASRYNAAADRLESDPDLRRRALQISVPQADVVGRLERDRARVVAGEQAGARAVAAVLCAGPAELLWEPRAHRVAPGASPARPTPPPSRRTRSAARR